MFGFGKKAERELSAREVAQWLAKHAKDVRTNSAEDAQLYGRASLALATEREREVAMVNDCLAQ
jgi:precorrin-3B methylase